jgi:PAP2 superfamily
MKSLPYLVTAGLLAGLAFWLSPHFRLAQPFVGYAVGSAFLLFLAGKPEKIELGTTCLLGLIMAAAITQPGRLPSMMVSLAAGFGLAGMANMISSAIWQFPRPRTETMRALGPACALIFFVGSAVNTLMAGFFRQRTYDLYVYALDGSFGTQISFLAGSLIRGKVLPTYAVIVTYEFIVVAIAAFYAAFMHRRSRPVWELMELFFGASLLGYFFYTIFPATGPGYVFGGFPMAFMSMDQLRHFTPESIPIAMLFPRNAVPSLHFSWALMIWWNSKSLPKWAQLIAGLFVLGTAFSAMAIGEHYLFDLIVALPFSLMVQALMIRTVKLSDPARWVPAAAGLVMFALWMVICRFATQFMLTSAVLPWSLAVLTSTVCLIWAFRLPALIPEMEKPQPAPARAFAAAASV